MTDEHLDAIKALMRAIDHRLAAAPLVERRGVDRRIEQPASLFEASAARGPVERDFAYWLSQPAPGAARG